MVSRVERNRGLGRGFGEFRDRGITDVLKFPVC